ncbi:MAG: methionyl-tRNA formyltransferase [Acidaminococcaceae bacterium]|nr:methionyl-tRNA formyltransferase [Acidaminococcaceae bacterium]MDD4721547.1 methionyl-tRNA formyltransferase [Acidaminococcaceae bacterium]
MQIVFMGSPNFAVDSLDLLHNSPKHEIVAVVTQPDRPKGRGQKVLMTAVKAYALQANLPVLQPSKVKTEEFIQKLQKLAPDLIVVAAFGQFLPKAVLELPKFGCINVHASLLPKYRGAAPIHYAILQGEKEAGVTIMQMDIGMDTGDMLAKVSVPIDQEMTMGELHDILKIKGAQLLLEVIEGLEAGTVEAIPQDDAAATYASLLTRDMEKINWFLSAQKIHDQVRAFNPFPSSFTTLPDGKNLKIWQTKISSGIWEETTPGVVVAVEKAGFVVATGKGFLEILEVQPESKKRMPAKVFCNGRGINVGEKFTCEEAK